MMKKSQLTHILPHPRPRTNNNAFPTGLGHLQRAYVRLCDIAHVRPPMAWRREWGEAHEVARDDGVVPVLA